MIIYKYIPSFSEGEKTLSTRQLLMKVPTDIATKFKVNAAINGMTMTELFIELTKLLQNPEPCNKKTSQITPLKNTSKISDTSRQKIDKNAVPDFKLVDVKNIQFDSKATRRISKTIKDLADSITKIGLIKPLLLLQTGIDAYLLLSNESEFQAVKRANLQNPQKCEMVNAMVISKNALKEAIRQKDMLNKIK